MKKLLRALLAGWLAKKAGYGCFGTILIFIIIYWLTNTFSKQCFYY